MHPSPTAQNMRCRPALLAHIDSGRRCVASNGVPSREHVTYKREQAAAAGACASIMHGRTMEQQSGDTRG